MSKVLNYRSSVLAASACVASEQPLASKIGYDILQKGGNAADAAIAMASAVGFLSPYLSGLGGDCNVLFYRASDSSVSSIHGSGRSARDLTLQKVKDAGFSLDRFKSQFGLDAAIKVSNNGLFVNVPGYVTGIFDLLDRFGSGKLAMKNLLDPTIELAQQGAPLSVKSAMKMQNAFDRIKKSKNLYDIFGDHGPIAGGFIRAPKLADSMKILVEDGPQAFYTGKIAENVVKAVQEQGGLLTMDDMKYHLDSAKTSLPGTPLFKDFHGVRLWEMSPNTTGIVVLYALNLLEQIDLKALGHNSAEYIHVVARALKTAFTDCWMYLCDPEHGPTTYEELLTAARDKQFKKQLDAEKPGSKCINKPFKITNKSKGADTSYVTVVDKEGNSCSLIFSVYSFFGSGNIPDNCGFILHDRGKLFSFDENNANVFGPRKRSLHTIIPAIVTDSSNGELLASFGVVGGWMQPQGHVQVLLNMIIFGMDPQTALEQPRFCIGNPSLLTGFRDSLDILNLEEGISSSVAPDLKAKDHIVPPIYTGLDRSIFGTGQVIAKAKLWNKEMDEKSQNVWWAGSDVRSDGIPIGY